MRHCLTLLLSVLTATAVADDWPQWGGPVRDCVWRETGIVEKLPAGKLPRVWSTPIAEGYSGPAVADGRVFVTDRIHAEGRHGTERVLALDAESGTILWKHEYPCSYANVSYPAGPRATPVINDGRVYTVGAAGHLFCLNASTGDVIWSKDFQTDLGTKLPTWGMAASPLVDGNQLIVLAGAPGGLIISFDKMTGAELWRALDDPGVGYSPPVIFQLSGVRQLIIWHPTHLSALNPQNGTLNWQIPFDVRFGLTAPMPRQHDNRIFVTAFYNGPMMVEVEPNGRDAQVLWKGRSDSETQTDGIHSIMSTPWFDGQNIYGVDSYGQFRGLDAKTGQRLWETRQPTGDGRWWNVFIIPHEDRFFLHNEQGELITAKLSPDGYTETSRALLVEPTREVNRRMTIWSHPAFAMKSVFARNDQEIVRVNLRK